MQRRRLRHNNMTQTAQESPKKGASSQKFTEILEIRDDIIIFAGGNACLIIEVRSTNFALLSQEEQEAKIGAYAAFLNSLSFPIQILVRNKAVDVSSYLKLLEIESQKTQNPKLATHIDLYRQFIQELVKVNTVLDKKFYIVLPYSSSEKGVAAVMKTNNLFEEAKAALHTKVDSLLNQLARLSLHAQVLQKEQLATLFYDLFNPPVTQAQHINETFQAPLTRKGTTK